MISGDVAMVLFSRISPPHLVLHHCLLYFALQRETASLAISKAKTSAYQHHMYMIMSSLLVPCKQLVVFTALVVAEKTNEIRVI